MTDKPRLRVVEGVQEQLARKIFKLIISPENHNDEVDRLLAGLAQRGDLSLVQGGQDCPPDTGSKEQGDKQ